MSKELDKKINDKIIMEMESSLGQSAEVIRFIIEEALKDMNIRQTNDDKTFDLIEIETYTKNILKQARNFISTMEYEKLFLTPPTSDEVCRELEKEYRAVVEYKNGTFIACINNTFYFKVTCVDEEVGFCILDILPPHLITLIGRFYEGVINNEN